MGKLIYYYGAMGCSKTANALMTRFQYETNNRKVWLIKPAVDNRDDKIVDNEHKAIVKSRIGLEAEAYAVSSSENIVETYSRFEADFYDVDVIICDECQFLTPQQVIQLKQLSESKNLLIYCYGLRTDFRTDLFPGSAKLFSLADDIIQLESICECGRPAIVNARFVNGKVTIEGNQVEIGGDDKYKALCWKCWQKALGKNKMKKVF